MKVPRSLELLIILRSKWLWCYGLESWEKNHKVRFDGQVAWAGWWGSWAELDGLGGIVDDGVEVHYGELTRRFYPEIIESSS